MALDVESGNDQGIATKSIKLRDQENVKGINIRFTDLSYSIKKRDGSEVKILQSVNGKCNPGRILAIMGQSGSGKTSLLDILACNYYRGGIITGNLLYDGKEVDAAQFRKQTCYVMQRDTLLSVATVREAMRFSAILRLPASVSTGDKIKRAEQVICEMGLEECADVLIGDEAAGLKGISGGQKRRLSVGLELVTNPTCLFLDEPTSGLDSEIAESIMSTLKHLASQGRTVVCTIHQPNTHISNLFDDFMLLARGRQVYCGAWSDSLDFFARGNHVCPQYTNPSDHYIRVVANQEAATRLVELYEKEYNGVEQIPSEGNIMASQKTLESQQQKLSTQVSWFQQLYRLCIRFGTTWMRNPMLFWAEFIQYLIVGLLVGLMYLRVDKDTDGLFDRSAAIWYILVVLSFVPSFTASIVWDFERKLLKRESQQGYYSTSAFYAAKTLTTSPVEISFALLTTIVVVFMVGLQHESGKFFIFWLVMSLALNCAATMGELCAIITPRSDISIILLTVIALALLSFTGFLISETPVYFKWIAKISFLNYSTAALMESELTGLKLTNDDGESVGAMSYFEEYTDDTGLSTWGNIGVLAAIAFGLKMLGMVGLWLMQRLDAI